MKLGLFGFQFKALGGRNEIQLYAESEAHAVFLAEQLLKKVQKIEMKFSRYREDSVISQINLNAGGRPIKVDLETAHLLDHSQNAYTLSNGHFDITSGVLRRVWDFSRKKIPTSEELKTILPLIGWNKVEWNNPYFRLPLKGMQIDFGGIGKEYAADAIAQECRERGVTQALINLGGDICAVGSHPNGQPWRVGIRHPRLDRNILSYVELIDSSLATSGDYERFFEHDGARYCHLLHPLTGMSANEFQSVSIVTSSCLKAGILSTSAMILGQEPGISFLNRQVTPYLARNQQGELFYDPSSMTFRLNNFKSNVPQATSTPSPQVNYEHQ